ncbi:MAG: DNA polymerase IV [Proteobacteria bacterium]|nr:DNA polymerase IV [Pseudomonadota bacterium]
METRQRKIIHVDMDCFYAAVEMRDDPSLKGHPIAVGGAADRRGVISTCNYEARAFGVHSAMATAYALRLCPALRVLPGRMSYYTAVSKQIRAIFRRYTDIIEPLSLDEAFLDVSDIELHQGSATLIAKDIRDSIRRELNLTASAGVAPNKFLAKICSDENKPDGQRVVTPAEVDEFVRELPLEKISGVGKVTLVKLARHGLHTCADIRAMGETELIRLFGGFGNTLSKRAYGIDNRALTTRWVRKSLSVERTFPQDLPDPASALDILDRLFEELVQRLDRNGNKPIRNQLVKLKFSDFQVTTMERRSNAVNKALFADLMPMAWERGGHQGIRLLGIGVTFSEGASIQDSQLALF